MQNLIKYDQPTEEIRKKIQQLQNKKWKTKTCVYNVLLW